MHTQTYLIPTWADDMMLRPHQCRCPHLLCTLQQGPVLESVVDKSWLASPSQPAGWLVWGANTSWLPEYCSAASFNGQTWLAGCVCSFCYVVLETPVMRWQSVCSFNLACPCLQLLP